VSRSQLPDLCQCVLAVGAEAIRTAEPCLPLQVSTDICDSLRALYRCPDCLRSWTVWWDRRSAGWPAIASAA
jgi:hypothetical protein